MRGTLFLLACAVVGSTQVALAALPPFYQSRTELSRLIQDSRVAEAFGSGKAIVSIKRDDTGYLLRSERCSLHVSIRYLPLPRGMTGPARFEFDVPSNLICAN